ncbi:putative 3-beta hydroxysteroid dehydrogenase/isomerase family protein [Neohortaea acidophila]|uniref:Putative 3-beta hydroxysteroid dehydrogenase/isomerase family protein n=1 Tax=Neohortaea acidophila TaxID=245834 RepID=A0A6A6PYN5_9PEZI|nr:putative 3-beta hydroxysteroid dehydrogenase/isomerase family protein [Neohortaea acidophila]KAF2485240.1 putative 3-beta hydroxysteroid dehydrogenase/isomerase family protein [Neohortaea acidophila]
MSVDVSGVSPGTVLVIGGSGFVGRHCIQHLLREGVSSMHTLNSRMPPEDRRIAGVEYHAVDLGNAAGVEGVMRLAKPNVVIHLASPRPFIEQAPVYERVNIQGIRNILAACDAVAVTKAFVYCSSVPVIFRSWTDIVGGDESWPVLYAPEQKEFYFHSKAMGEKLVLQHNRQNKQNMLTTALRVTSIFGEDDWQIIGGLISRAKTGQLNTQIGDGKNLNDWTYVGNVTAAHVLAAKRLLRAGAHSDPPEQRVEGEAFFITNDDPRPFWDFGRQVAAEAGFPVRPEDIKILPAIMAYLIGVVAEWYVFLTSFGRRKSQVSRAVLQFAVINQVFCIDKAKRQLGYRPLVSIDEAIKRSVASFQERDDGEYLAKTK